MNALAEATSGKVNREEEYVAERRTHVQTSQRFIQQLAPWIDQAEIYLTKRLDQMGALNLTEAKQLHDRHKVRENFISIFNHLFLAGISRRTSSNVTYLQ